MAGKNIEKAFEKCDKLPQGIIRDIEKQVLAFQAGSAEVVLKWHDEEEVEDGDTVVELVYRVRVIEK